MKTTTILVLALLSTSPGSCDSFGPGCVPRFATGGDVEDETPDPGTSTGMGGSTGDEAGAPPPVALTDNASGSDESTSLGASGWTTSTSTTSESGEPGASTATDWTWTTTWDELTTTSDPDETSTSGPADLCGNGIVDIGEECDDADDVHFNECSNLCHDNTNSGCNELFLNDPACEGLYCVAPGLCGGCQTIPAPQTCSDANADTPACDEVSGLCVQCTPDDESACGYFYEHCNPFTLECDQCIAHEQCDGSVCLFEMGGTGQENAKGECAPPASLAWVQQQMACQDKTGSQEQPYCTIAEAVADPRPEWSDTLVIMLDPAPAAYEATIEVSGREIAIVGTSVVPTEYPTLTTPGGAPLASVMGGYVLFSRVQLRDSDSLQGPLITIENGEGELEHTIVSGNSGAIKAMNSDFEIYHSVLTGNTGSGSEFAYSYVNIANTFITVNDAGSGAPVILSGDSYAFITYSTIAGNQGDYASTIGCNGDGATPHVTNSIVLYVDDDGFYCEDQPLGGLVGDFATLKDDTFVGYDGGVYRVDANSLAKGEAGSSDFDPYTDYDGDLRPRHYGALEYVGADRPPP